MRCSLCSNPCRSRTSALVLLGNSAPVRKLVCSRCAAGGTLIVPEVIEAPSQCGACSERPAAVCAVCAGDQARKPDNMQLAIGKKLDRLAKLADASSQPEAAKAFCLSVRNGGAPAAAMEELQAVLVAEYERGRAFGLEQAAEIVRTFRTAEAAQLPELGPHGAALAAEGTEEIAPEERRTEARPAALVEKTGANGEVMAPRAIVARVRELVQRVGSTNAAQALTIDRSTADRLAGGLPVRRGTVVLVTAQLAALDRIDELQDRGIEVEP